MPTYTLTQLGTQALRDIGCLRPGQKTSPDVLVEVLDVANQRIDLWTLDDRVVYAYPSSIFTLQAGLQQYRIGPGQAPPNFNAGRPTGIADANILLNTVSPVVRRPLELIDKDQWASIAVQSIPFAVPLSMYYDGDFDPTSGYATINLWPGPQTTYQLELFTQKTMPFTGFADLTTGYSYPPGYALLIRKQVAMDLVPMMDIAAKTYRLNKPRAPMVQMVKAQLGEAMAIIASYNEQPPKMAGDPAYASGSHGSGWNYAIGDYGRGNR